MKGLLTNFNKLGGFKQIKGFVKSRAILTILIELLLLGKEHTALEIIRLSTQFKTKKYLKRKYKNKIIEYENSYNEQAEKIHEKKIWVCWLQGYDEAPEIVKLCIGSLYTNIKGREIILITEQNYCDFIAFPEYIQNKIDNGTIKGAHMTDLLRLELLNKYGGTWIDSTVLCTSNRIPEYMLDSDFFMFQCLKPGRDGHTNIASNWFITSSSNNKILYLIKAVLYDFWKDNDELIDYFMFHETMRMIIERCPKEWSRVIPFSSATPHILLLRLFDEYDETTWNAVLEQTPFHKLTYKFDEKMVNLDNTYYREIIRTCSIKEIK